MKARNDTNATVISGLPRILKQPHQNLQSPLRLWRITITLAAEPGFPDDPPVGGVMIAADSIPDLTPN
jgi:hypothetical protein